MLCIDLLKVRGLRDSPPSDCSPAVWALPPAPHKGQAGCRAGPPPRGSRSPSAWREQDSPRGGRSFLPPASVSGAGLEGRSCLLGSSPVPAWGDVISPGVGDSWTRSCMRSPFRVVGERLWWDVLPSLSGAGDQLDGKEVLAWGLCPFTT